MKAVKEMAMSNETDLDWLARNVHEWPAGDHQPWCYVYMVAGGAMKASGNFLDAVAYPIRITKGQWLSRRAELQNKPSWEDAPEWAEWIAQDDDGEWKWLGSNPSKYINGWTANKLSCCKKMGSYGSVIEKGTILGDWRDTLEKRPADLSEQAVTARLQEATNNVLAAAPELMTDKYKFEPFVSVEDERQVLSELEMLAKVSHLISDKRHRITTSKYTKTIHGVSVDVYDVLQAWGVGNPALQHLIKKALQCGQRGHKDNAQDLQDIIDSAIRAKELEC